VLLLVAFSRWRFNYWPTFDTQSALHVVVIEVEKVGSSLFQVTLKTIVVLKMKVWDFEILTAVLMKIPVLQFMMSCTLLCGLPCTNSTEENFPIFRVLQEDIFLL